MYTVEDAKEDMRTLIARLEALQDRQAVVAHLIKLAIGNGCHPRCVGPPKRRAR